MDRKLADWEVGVNFVNALNTFDFEKTMEFVKRYKLTGFLWNVHLVSPTRNKFTESQILEILPFVISDMNEYPLEQEDSRFGPGWYIVSGAAELGFFKVCEECRKAGFDMVGGVHSDDSITKYNECNCKYYKEEFLTDGERALHAIMFEI